MQHSVQCGSRAEKQNSRVILGTLNGIRYSSCQAVLTSFVLFLMLCLSCRQIGRNLIIPGGTRVIDARGLYLLPGRLMAAIVQLSCSIGLLILGSRTDYKFQRQGQIPAFPKLVQTLCSILQKLYFVTHLLLGQQCEVLKCDKFFMCSLHSGTLL